MTSPQPKSKYSTVVLSHVSFGDRGLQETWIFRILYGGSIIYESMDYHHRKFAQEDAKSRLREFKKKRITTFQE
jgi:hypothetical protein